MAGQGAGATLLVGHLHECSYSEDADNPMEPHKGAQVTILLGPAWALEVVPRDLEGDGGPEHVKVHTMAGTFELATTEEEVYAELGIMSKAEAAEAQMAARKAALQERQKAIRRAILSGNLSPQEMAVLKAEAQQIDSAMASVPHRPSRKLNVPK